MATEFYIADPTDPDYPEAPTTKLIDFTALDDGSTTGFGLVGDPDFGGGGFDPEWIESDLQSGAIQSSHRHPVEEMSFRLFHRSADYDGHRDEILALAEALEAGGVMVWRPNGATDYRYIDFYPSPFPEDIRGQDRAIFKMVSLLMDADGLPIKVWRKPYYRHERDAGTPVTLTNGPLGREVIVSNPGNVPALTIVKAVPEAGAKFGLMRIAVRSKGNLTEFGTKYAFGAEGATLYGGASGDTSAGTAATGYTGTGAAQTTFTNIESMARRWKKVITVTDETALEGAHNARIRLTVYGGTTRGKQRYQLRWGFVDIDPVSFSNDVIEIDWDDVDNIDWIELDFGDVVFGKGGTDLVLELWAARDSGDDNLATDLVTLYPCDEQTVIASVPGHRYGGWGREKWRGDELVSGPFVTGAGESAGDIRENSARVNEADEVMAAPPDTGFALSAGIHVVTADTTVFEAASSAQITVGKLEVLDDSGGGGAWVVRKSVKLKSRKNRNKVERKRKLTFTVTAGDVAAGRKFIFRVKMTAATADGRKILIHFLRHSFLNTITDDNTLVLDGFNRQACVKDTATDGTLFPVIVEGQAFLLAPPGDSSWVFQFGDMPTDPGYDDLDIREPHARIVGTRSVEVTIDKIPRSTH